LYSKIREKLFPKFDLNFVQICPEKLMKNFNGLKRVIQTRLTAVHACFSFVTLRFALCGGFIVPM
jgi:hypothetical protein